MRSYIFTEEEIKRLINWLEKGEETTKTTVTLSRIRQNADMLSVHLNLMRLCLKKMSQQDRLVGRLKLPSKLKSRIEQGK